MKKILMSVTLLAIILAGCDSKDAEKTEPPQPTEQTPPGEIEADTKNVSPTTGLAFNQFSNNFAVMVENTKQARPQTGLADADVVYEVTVEADITRFMAIYHDEIPEKIGPARSSRDYFIDLTKSWNAPYIHFGASPQAYAMLADLTLSHIDGITNGKYFSRDNTRKAPHNAYLHPDKLPTFPEKIKNELFTFAKPGATLYLEAPSALDVRITYNDFTHVGYVYDATTKKYVRSLEGKSHADRESNVTISPSNVIIQYTEQTNLNDDKGRISVEFGQSGKAIVFTQGKLIEGQWKNDNGTMKYLDDEGDIVELTPGKTWIQVVDDKDIVSYQ